jgi:hypothetical protein
MTVENPGKFMENSECLIIELLTLWNLEPLIYVKVWKEFDIRYPYCHVFMVVTNNNGSGLDDLIY